MKRKKFSDSYQQLTTLIQILMQNAILVNSALCEVGLPDAKDVMFLDLAISGAADALVTGKATFPSSDEVARVRGSPQALGRLTGARVERRRRLIRLSWTG